MIEENAYLKKYSITALYKPESFDKGVDEVDAGELHESREHRSEAQDNVDIHSC